MTEEQIAISMAFKNAFSGENREKALDALDKKCMYKRHGIYNSENERQTCFNLGMHEVILFIHQEIDREITEKKESKAIHKEI